jgi:hypothetical protein
MQPVKIYGVYDDGTTEGLTLPLAIDSSGNLDIAGDLGTDVTTLDADVVTLNGHVVTLDTDVNLLTTAVNAMTATQAASTAVYSGTKTAPVNGSPGEIVTTTQACKSVILQAPVGDNQSVLYGASSTTCTMELVAGAVSPALNVANVNLIFVKSAGASTQTVNWIAKN